MLRIGILCSPKELGEEIAQILELLFAQSGLDPPVLLLSEEKRQELERCSYLVLGREEGEEAFLLAERIWEELPDLPVIFIARDVKEIFRALGMPFFHTVRSFALEEDLRAAVRKITHFKVPLTEKIDFVCNGKKLLVRRRDILYLESDHHDVRLHLTASSRRREPPGSGEVCGSGGECRKGNAAGSGGEGRKGNAAGNGDILPEGEISCGGKRVETVTETLTQCEEKLKGLGFVRIHRSLLVNMYHIESMEKDFIEMANGERLYISRYRIQEVRFQFDNYIRRLGFM